VGLAAARPAWLDGLYVVPDCWRTDVATRLDDHAVARLATLGHKRCHLWVLEDNRRARRFYERRGWRAGGTIEMWRGLPVAEYRCRVPS
jgi:GNAT superfamily N-acetyltransferase